jgi:predicted SnoaL-like aldol condensation-catalyzing enzyme
VFRSKKVDSRIVTMSLPMLFLGINLASAQSIPQGAPVVAVDDPESLFIDDDPVIHRNKQTTLHILRELFQCNQWDRADEWLTERYIQHNPNAASGQEALQRVFARGSDRTENCGEFRGGIVAVLGDDDIVAVIYRAVYRDPRNSDETYTSTYVDMWRFVEGKADEHWDSARLNTQ